MALRIGLLADSSLIAVRVGEIRRVACASPDYLKAHGTPKTPDDLATHDCVSFAGLTDAERVDVRARKKPSMLFRCVQGSSSAMRSSACDAARAGLGVTVAFSHHVSEFVKEGTLTALLDEFQPAPLPVSFVYASNRFMPIKLRAFLDFAAPRMKVAYPDATIPPPSDDVFESSPSEPPAPRTGLD